jgi:hypothetical protein
MRALYAKEKRKSMDDLAEASGKAGPKLMRKTELYFEPLAAV